MSERQVKRRKKVVNFAHLFAMIPHDTWKLAFTFLELDDLFAIELTCREFASLVPEVAKWKMEKKLCPSAADFLLSGQSTDESFHKTGPGRRNLKDRYGLLARAHRRGLVVDPKKKRFQTKEEHEEQTRWCIENGRVPPPPWVPPERYPRRDILLRPFFGTALKNEMCKLISRFVEEGALPQIPERVQYAFRRTYLMRWLEIIPNKCNPHVIGSEMYDDIQGTWVNVGCSEFLLKPEKYPVFRDRRQTRRFGLFPVFRTTVLYAAPWWFCIEEETLGIPKRKEEEEEEEEEEDAGEEGAVVNTQRGGIHVLFDTKDIENKEEEEEEEEEEPKASIYERMRVTIDTVPWRFLKRIGGIFFVREPKTPKEKYAHFIREDIESLRDLSERLIRINLQHHEEALKKRDASQVGGSGDL